jgi:hypothetical protein
MTIQERFFGSTTGPSPSGTLNVTDWKKIGRGALFAGGGAIVAYLISLLPGLNFGQFNAYAGLIVPVASILLNAAAKFFDSNQ